MLAGDYAERIAAGMQPDDDENSGTTPPDLAEETGVPLERINKILSGEFRPREDDRAAIESALSIDLTEEDMNKLMPSDIRDWFEAIPDEDITVLGIDPERSRPEWMILTVLPVPPVTARPSITLDNGQRSEDDLTHKLVDPDNVDQLVGQVVLGALAVVQRDRGAGGHRRDRQHGEDHPLGPGAVGVDPEYRQILVGDVLEPVPDVARHQLVHVLLGEVDPERFFEFLAVVLPWAELAGHDFLDPREVDPGFLGEFGRCDPVVVLVVGVGLHRGGDLLGVVTDEHVLNLVVGGRLLVFDVVLDGPAVRTPLLSGVR